MFDINPGNYIILTSLQFPQQSVRSHEEEATGDERREESEAPYDDPGDTNALRVQEEIRVRHQVAAGVVQDRGVELQERAVNEDEREVAERKKRRKKRPAQAGTPSIIKEEPQNPKNRRQYSECERYAIGCNP